MASKTHVESKQSKKHKQQQQQQTKLYDLSQLSNEVDYHRSNESKKKQNFILQHRNEKTSTPTQQQKTQRKAKHKKQT